MERETNLAVGAGSRGASAVTYTLHDDVQGRAMKERRAANEGTAHDSGKPSDVIHVRAYNRGNWFTSSGVTRKRREIEAKGLPSFECWRFLTLTIDPELFDLDPWKLEFQENGWPHWHVLFDRTAKYSEEQLAEIGKLWGFGRTNVEMVRNDDFLYSFKYAFKPVQCVEDADLFDFEPAVAPAWFLDYETRDDSGRVVTFAKTRFWQTSRNFYTKRKDVEAKPKKEPQSCQLQFPARVNAERQTTTVQAVARKSSGKYIASAVIALTCATGFLWRSVAWDTLHGHAVGLAVNNYVIPTSTLEKHAKPCHKLKHLRSATRLSLAKAQRLAKEGTRLRTC
jgi:hypothetical protein